MKRAWWKEGVVYQIYPRSFKDSDGNGVGDLRGIISKLDYIESLGVDIIWLNPVYKSPNTDNGYDISDYEAIMEEFGTMADFDELLEGLHNRGIKLVMDLVVNHSSDEHRWFRESRSSRDNPYRDFYHWWPAEKGVPPYRRSFFDVTGNAWTYDKTTNAYYLHYFSRKQPDLKWENPELRQAIYTMMRNWFDKGVDGFRMDVISFISKDTTYPRVTEEELRKIYGDDIWGRYYADGPNLHAYLREMNEEVLSRYDVMALGEGAGVTIDNALKFVDEDRKELDLFFHFEGVSLGYAPGGYKQPDPAGWNLVKFKDVYTRWSDVFAKKGWGSIYLGNHDQPRMVSRWGNDAPEYHDKSAELLQTFLLSMRGTAFIYYGDEIGMTNIRFDNIEDYRDIETINWYKQLKNMGKDTDKYMEGWKLSARDNGRTPMQWDNNRNAGFTSGTPWIKVNPNHKEINVVAQENDPGSILNYFRRMIRLRKDNPVLVYGSYELLSPDHPQIYAYVRTLDKSKMLVLLNFSTEKVEYQLPAGIKVGNVEISNYDVTDANEERAILYPYQAVIFTLK
ncbi:MAG: alpha-glucosidase [FCB group bacterium]|nr:alpha-glucosidase [FCB group bacterium]